MSKIICPYCFHEFNGNDVMFRCTNSSCPAHKEEDRELNNFWRESRTPGHAFKSGIGLGKLFGKTPESAKCDRCKETSYTVICPHCHNILPKEMVREKGYIIAIVGAVNSGKTNYISVLINELFRNAHKLGDIGIQACGTMDNDTDMRYKNDFYNHLYRDHICHEKTDTQDSNSKKPLIYELSQKGKPSIFLIFYDTAGEHFQNLSTGNTHSSNSVENQDVAFLTASDAIIYLLDTFNIEKVHDKLSQQMNLPPIGQQNPSYDFILNKLLTYFKSFDNTLKAKMKNTPIALTFSKFDAVLSNPDMSSSVSGMKLSTNSRFLDGSGIYLSDFDQVHEGIEGALNGAWEEWNTHTTIDTFFNKGKYHYFGISALGKDKDKNNKVDSIEPYRVLDPLVWLLYKLGYSLNINKE